MLERMMVMMVKLQPRMYPLLPLRRLRCRMVHPLHRLQFSKIKWKQLLRGRLSPSERHRGALRTGASEDRWMVAPSCDE
jgi:hypothetical protein